MATTFLTERLMRAVDTLLVHGERVEVAYVGAGARRNAMILGRGAEAGTVRLGVWCESGEIREASRPIRFTDCVLPDATERRLIEIVSHQAPIGVELERAMRFIESARYQRTRDGRFADGTHRAEPRGTR